MIEKLWAGGMNEDPLGNTKCLGVFGKIMKNSRVFQSLVNMTRHYVSEKTNR